MGFVSYAVSATGATPTASTCRASLARVTLAGQVLAEPFVANDAGAPCVAEDASLIGDFDLDPIPASGKLLYSQTHDNNPNAEAGVADITLALSAIDPSLPDISAQLLTSRAGVDCTGGTPHTVSSSRVLGLQVGGEDVLVIPPDDAFAEIPADPLVNVKVNETTTSGNTVTRRALHINALAGNLDVVVSEATAGFAGNPCGTPPTTTRPPTSPPPTTPPPTSPPPTSPPPTTAPPTSAPPAADIVGWMNGGGQLADNETHSFVLPCTRTQKHPKPHLQVQTPNGATFRLDTLSTVGCAYDKSEGAPEQPDAGFNTLTGTGKGTCGNAHNVPVSFRFTDEGEPNQGADEATITITNAACPVNATGTVNGNHQAHRGTNPPA